MLKTAITIAALFTFFTTIGVLTPTTVFAHGGAKGIVKERMDSMKEMGDAMKVMGDMVKGKLDFEQSAFHQGAKTVSKHSPQIPKLFPEGSGGGVSEALPKLWLEWDQFKSLADHTTEEAQKLGELSGNGANRRALTKQFINLGKSCKSCHTDYRKKKKEKH
ncbi:MAG: cytochrome c [Motiliproteus sp.]|nr:cytochrome c [Motiliproteus sp.]